MSTPNPIDSALDGFLTARRRVVLAAVIEATPHLGRPPSRLFLERLLGGARAIGYPSRALASYGALGRPADARREIEAAVTKGLLDRVASPAPGLVLTLAGRRELDPLLLLARPPP
jgi:hypothetical protein